MAAVDSSVVTSPRAFLRWHPVTPPILVAGNELGYAEPLERLVISGDKTTARHIVPPKATQLEAEQFGEFDWAIGSTDRNAQDRALAMALKERGTLLDEWIQDIDNANVLIRQEGIRLAQRPGADPDTLVTLEEISETRDTPLGEGQYVVHETEQLVLPYLPDPLAYGISLVFYDAGPPHTMPDSRILQTVVLPFDGAWPSTEPIRLVVEPGDELDARREQNEVRVSVPPGQQVRLQISSALDEGKLPLLGLWSSSLAAPELGDEGLEQARALLARAAANGWFWWLTPSQEMRLVHAVPKPVRPPELVSLAVAERPPGLTEIALAGVVDVHGNSTENLVVEASWDEWVDDPATPGPERTHHEDIVVSSEVQPSEKYGLLWKADAVIGAGPARPPVFMHRALQNFADTHHRRVTYTPSGATRYSEFFEAGELPAPDAPELAGDPRELTVVSSARPAA